MTTTFDLTAVFTDVENGWIQARIAELPGVITAAPTLDEVKTLLADALHEYLLATGELESPSTRADASEGSRVAVTIEV